MLVKIIRKLFSYKQKLKNLWINAFFIFFYKSKVISKTGSIIIIYHGITSGNPKMINSKFISKKKFESQIKFFSKYFKLVNVDDIFTNNLDSNKFSIAITFDDGFKNNFENAVPILEKYNVPATFFVSTINVGGGDILWADYIDVFTQIGPNEIYFEDVKFIKNRKPRYFSVESGLSLNEFCNNAGTDIKKNLVTKLSEYGNPKLEKEYFEYWKLMSENDLQYLARSSLFSLGSHGVYHNKFTKIDLDDVKNELIDSKRYLEKITNHRIDKVAFPSGAYNADIVSLAENCGYKYQLSMDYVKNEDKNDSRMQARFGINPFIEPNTQFYYIYKGAYV